MVIRITALVVVLSIVGLLLYGEWLRRSVETAFPARGNFVEVAGGRIHYREQPATRDPRGTVVLLHGASSDSADVFETLLPELAAFRVIAPDRPGHGWSDRLAGAGMANPGRQAEALMQALDRLAPERFVLVAHSLAGAAATRIALQRPERLHGLVLLGGVTHPWPGGIAWYHHATAAPFVGPVFTRLVAVPLASRLLDTGATEVFAPNPVTPDYLATGEIPLLLRAGQFRANSQDIAASHAFVTAQASRYRELKTPVIAITGDADAIVSPVIHSMAIVRQAPQARLVLLPGVGHMPHHAAPEIVASAIDELAGPRTGLALAR